MQEDLSKFQKPAVAVDVVLLTILEGKLKIALIKRPEQPYEGMYALPGRFVRYDEPLTESVRQAIRLKGNIEPKEMYLEQLHAFGDDLNRDTRIRSISIVYFALISPKQVASGKNSFHWMDAAMLPQMAFDHEELIHSSLQRIRKNLFTSNLIFALLYKEFTLSELQETCEILIGETLDKRNFRKKILEVYELKDLKRTKMEGAHRPAALYEYVRMH